MTVAIVTRRAGIDDIDTLLRNAAVGLASYSAFAPPGWRPPERDEERDRRAELVADPATWALLALVDGTPAGHVTFMPARERTADETPGAWQTREVIPGLAHFSQLFVLPDWWGRGVAPVLHDAAITEMREQGYESARLFNPTDHARARRFYERRGWRGCDERFNDELALRLTEYRLALVSGD
jgi:GNAT superfamily N-acetyltransferase